jgi:hypothetical protein
MLGGALLIAQAKSARVPGPLQRQPHTRLRLTDFDAVLLFCALAVGLCALCQ